MHKRLFAILFAVGFLARAAMLLLMPQAPVEYDAEAYRTIAENWIAGRGYSADPVAPHTFAYTRSPILPLVLAGTYRFAGDRSPAAYWIQAVADSVTCGLLGVLGLLVFGRAMPGVAAGLFWALNPAAWQPVRVLLTEPLFGCLLTASLCLAARWHHTRRMRDWILFFAMMGLASLTRGSLLMFPVAYVGGHVGLCLLRREGVAAAVARGAVGLAVFFAVLAPWSLYASRQMGSFVLENKGGADAFLRGNYDEGTFGCLGNSGSEGHPLPSTALEGLSINQSEARRSAFTREYMRTHPRVVARLWLAKFWRLWFNLAFQDPPSLASLSYALTQLVLLILAGAGFASMTAAAFARLAPALGLIGYFTAVHVITYSLGRYSMPLMPLLVYPAAVGAERLWAVARGLWRTTERTP